MAKRRYAKVPWTMDQHDTYYTYQKICVKMPIKKRICCFIWKQIFNILCPLFLYKRISLYSQVQLCLFFIRGGERNKMLSIGNVKSKIEIFSFFVFEFRSNEQERFQAFLLHLHITPLKSKSRNSRTSNVLLCSTHNAYSNMTRVL